MIDIIAWLNTNQGAIIGIATIVLAVANIFLVCITLYYARLVWLQLKAADTPEIAIYLVFLKRYSGGATFTDKRLCIKNIGTGIAHDLRFETKNLPDGKGPPILENGIEYLEPGRQLSYYINLKNACDISITYRDSTKRKYERSFHLDPAELGNAVSGDDLSRIADTLSDIKSKIERISR